MCPTSGTQSPASLAPETISLVRPRSQTCSQASPAGAPGTTSLYARDREVDLEPRQGRRRSPPFAEIGNLLSGIAVTSTEDDLSPTLKMGMLIWGLNGAGTGDDLSRLAEIGNLLSGVAGAGDDLSPTLEMGKLILGRDGAGTGDDLSHLPEIEKLIFLSNRPSMVKKSEQYHLPK